MITEAEFLKALEIINNYKIQINTPYIEMRKVLDKNKISHSVITKETLLKESDLSIRAINALISFYYDYLTSGDKRVSELTIGDFDGVKKNDLCKARNMGRKSLTEIEKLFFEAGIII